MSTQPYSLSFTAATLRVQELVILAECMNRTRSIDSAVSEIRERNLYQRGNAESTRRLVTEMKARIVNLPSDVITQLPQLSSEAQRQVSFLAICLTFPIFLNFIDFLHTEKLPLLDMTLTDDDIQSFFYREEDIYDELYNTSDQTKSKVRQVMLKTLNEISLLDTNSQRAIQRLAIEPEVEAILNSHFPAMKRIFLPF